MSSVRVRARAMGFLSPSTSGPVVGFESGCGAVVMEAPAGAPEAWSGFRARLKSCMVASCLFCLLQFS